MRKLFKYLVTTFYKPFLGRYLSKTRKYRYKGINLIIPPEVFHPGFFFSTKLMFTYLDSMPVPGKTFLEVGAGNGLLSINAAKKNAKVTAIDINPVAIEYLKINAAANNVAMEIIQSDMFKKIPKQEFDFIIVTPPYFKKDPVSYKDYAWYCGENGEYFFSLFGSLSLYSNKDSTILMILSSDCDMEMIGRIASDNGFYLHKVFAKKNWIEENYIFKIDKKQDN